jgi:hypothetical protein
MAWVVPAEDRSDLKREYGPPCLGVEILGLSLD